MMEDRPISINGPKSKFQRNSFIKWCLLFCVKLHVWQTSDHAERRRRQPKSQEHITIGYLIESLAYPDLRFRGETVRLMLVLLDLSSDLSYSPPLTEVDQSLRTVGQEVWVTLLYEQDVA